MQDNWVVIGRFARVHGIKGFILVQSYTEPSNQIIDYPAWHIKIKNQWRPIKFHCHTERNDAKILVQVEHYSTREEAATLTHLEIAVPRASLPKIETQDSYYLCDLIGLTVLDNHGHVLGKVEDIMSTAANDIIIISGAKRILIPFIWDSFITSVDLEKKEISVIWDEV